MLKKFSIENFKNFRKSICIDFEKIAGYQFSTDCISNNLISKMVIYGRNATGKTNLGIALMNIYDTLSGRSRFVREGVFLNADATEDWATFSYTFQFDDKELVYQYARFSDFELRSEELIIDGNIIFNCNFVNKQFNLDGLKYVDAETANVERYLQALNEGKEIDGEIEPKLPFLRWLISNIALESDSILIKLYNYVERMAMITANNSIIYFSGMYNGSFYKSLEKSENLQDFEDFLNEMGIECKLELKKLPDGQRQLYFAHEKLVPFFESASSGTLALVQLYRRIVSIAREKSLLYLDEFDAFYHYEMAKNVVQYFKKKYPKCQLIMTSHNTSLMTNRLMRPDCLFILSSEGTLTALCDATERELREGHNLAKMYVSGEFEKYE
ncbi:MAG: ATP-binding protein [Lachnospiraceae bacterium]|nr:ATP-binding protein [Lachnospiraceae bacterium]